MGTKPHWENVWSSKQPTEVGWFSPENTSISVKMIDTWLPGDARNKHVVDSGAGASLLADKLLERQGWEVAVTDVSASVLETVRQRIPAEFRGRLRVIAGDIGAPILEIPDSWADVWHDRLSFHFLTDEMARHEYAKNVARILRVGGIVIVTTFALDGPERCSGLRVMRHDGASICAALSNAGREFQVVHEEKLEHTMPSGTVQNHVCVVLKMIM